MSRYNSNHCYQRIKEGIKVARGEGAEDTSATPRFTCFLLFSLLTSAVLLITPPSMAADETGIFPDKLGREAIHLWIEKERLRQADKTTQLLRDFQITGPIRRRPAITIYSHPQSAYEWRHAFLIGNNGTHPIVFIEGQSMPFPSPPELAFLYLFPIRLCRCQPG